MGSSAEKDRKTLEVIGLIYCRAHHKGTKDKAGLCPSCREAVEGTLERAQNCPNNHDGNCQDCDIKCQRGESQDRRAVSGLGSNQA